MLPRLFLSALPLMVAGSLAAAEPTKPIKPETDSHGKISVEMICHNRATDDRMALLPEHPGIQVLTAYGTTEFTDAGMVHVKKLTKLETLTIGGSKITEKGLENLKGHPSLKKLCLGNMPLTAKGMEHIVGIPNLETITIRSNTIEPEALAQLAKAENLRELRLQAHRIKDDMVPSLGKMKSLKTIVLLYTTLTENGIADLKKALPGVNVRPADSSDEDDD